MPSGISPVIRTLLLAACLCFGPGSAMAQTPACPASASWIGNQTPPTEIPGGGQNFCQFYQFAWQWFLTLTAPAPGKPLLRNFEVQQNYPLVQATQNTSCDASNLNALHSIFVRTTKPTVGGGKLALPKETGQAGGGATIYDQNGNVVFYEMRFSRGECTTVSPNNFPANTVELKTSWRILKLGEPGLDSYYKVVTIIDGVNNNQPVLLGMLGFHLAVSTASHPEFVWATFEHKSNSPECLKPEATPTNGWSFSSASCAACLASSKSGPPACNSGSNTCNYNNPPDNSQALTAAPTNICKVYRDGSAPTDFKVSENVPVVDSLNLQMVGPKGLLTQLPATNPSAVWKNYKMDGALWVSNTAQPSGSASGNTTNQRGSLQLASSVMETAHQGTFTNSATSAPVRTAATNCFGCHGYPGSGSSNTVVSHIYPGILPVATGSK